MKQILAQLIPQLLAKNYVLTTAESCTGGWVAKTLIDLTGSSSWFDCGFVTYSNISKQKLLHVPAQILQQYGAVSEQTVSAMVKGALKNANANFALAISGIAGPTGGSVEKPVGTICFAWMDKKNTIITTETKLFKGDRSTIRQQSVAYALKGVLKLIQ